MESALEVRQMSFLYALTIYLIQIRMRAGKCKRLAQMSAGGMAGWVNKRGTDLAGCASMNEQYTRAALSF
jgi:hypothetical protein